MEPRLIFLAGPNGAGKSTFFEAYLKSSELPFVNADRIAAALDISNEEAAVAADALRAQLIADRDSFITETVFSDPAGAKLKLLREAVAMGYRVDLYFVGLSSVLLSEARVAHRVRTGGHDVPTERLERRYRQSLKNLTEALTFVTEAHVFDNSSAEQPYRLVLSVGQGKTKFAVQPLPAWLDLVKQRGFGQ